MVRTSLPSLTYLMHIKNQVNIPQQSLVQNTIKQLEKFHCCLETSKWQTPQDDTISPIYGQLRKRVVPLNSANFSTSDRIDEIEFRNKR